MGGDQASTTRMRERGQICCSCKVPLQPLPASERYCARCAPVLRVYMHFHRAKEGWRVTFLEQDLKTSLKRRLVFQDPEKVIDLAKRGGADLGLAGRQALDSGIGNGRGGLWLKLSEIQYALLK